MNESGPVHVDTIRFGRGAGVEVEGLIDSATERVWIVSPYLGAGPLQWLSGAAERGVDVVLVTSLQNDTVGPLISAGLLHYSRQTRPAMMLSFIVVQALAVLTFPVVLVPLAGWLAWRFGIDWILLCGVCVTLPIWRLGCRRIQTYEYTFHSSIELVLKSGFKLHTKAFLVDDTAVFGSLNFSENGLFHNHEVSVFSDAPEVVDVLADEVAELCEGSRASLDAAGHDRFFLPRNPASGRAYMR